MSRIVAWIAALTFATPAWACMAEPPPYYLLFDTRPSTVPAGWQLFRVLARTGDAEGGDQQVLVAGRGGPRVARLAAYRWNSCVGLGSSGEPAWAVGRLRAVKGERLELLALAYRRSWFAQLLSLFGVERYLPAGEPI